MTTMNGSIHPYRNRHTVKAPNIQCDDLLVLHFLGLRFLPVYRRTFTTWTQIFLTKRYVLFRIFSNVSKNAFSLLLHFFFKMVDVESRKGEAQHSSQKVFDLVLSLLIATVVKYFCTWLLNYVISRVIHDYCVTLWSLYSESLYQIIDLSGK